MANEYENYDDLYASDRSMHSVFSETEVLNRHKQQSDTKFFKGCAISMWQNSGDLDSNWTRFTHERIRCGLKSAIVDGSRDVFPDTWNRYTEDIQLLKELGCNAFRMSIEWARIEPEKGRFDQDAIQRYHEIFDCLDENGITPCLTLHHFVHPGWFQDLGAFEREENIQLFVNYAIKAFEAFGNRARVWATFNEPTVYMFCSYLAGLHAPGKSFKFSLGGRVLWNILKAHCETYKVLKGMKGSENCMIGIVHHHIWFKPSGDSFFHFITKLACKWVTHWWGRDIVFEFFKTGTFKWKTPWFCSGSIDATYQEGNRPPLDWWGINYYSRIQASWRLTSIAENDEIMTEMSYPIYPKGLYRSIAAGSQLGLPMYITETGIADGIDDRRHIMIRGYTNEILRAIKHGYDVRGMFYWTLVDNFEWNLGYKVRFGLYEFSPNKGIDRRLRTNARPLQDIYKAWPNKIDEIYKFARKAKISPFEDITAEFLSQQKHKDQQSTVLPSYDG